MKMKRTQIYLTDEQYNNLSIESKKAKKTVSELIREAIEYRYKLKKEEDFDKIVRDVCGIWKDRKDIKSGIEYVNNIRSDRRLEELFNRK
ncbi:MAG: ribbon-helix-helix domain-containing protein [Actinobacteria bacterium]|nr:ribbon-helix-helix domain-containing protein [Actinomycetota bacterium]